MFSLPNNYTTWPISVRGYDTTDPVIGALSGQSNLPLEDLSDRTNFLFDHLGRFEDVIVFDSSVGISGNTKGILHYAQITSNIVFSMDDLANFVHGARLRFKCKASSNKSVRFDPVSGQKFKDGSQVLDNLWLHDGEDLELVAFKGGGDDHFVVLYGKGNFDKVGQDDLVRFQPRNSIIANGCNPESAGPLLLRADLQRLVDKVLPTAINDATWLSDISNRQYWSLGNGSTTMRPPDMRAMFFRGLDLGRSIRLGNLSSTPGSYEPDAFKSHSHSVDLPVAQHTASSSNIGVTDGPVGAGGVPHHYVSGDTGGPETVVKNAGFIPVVYY
jgi:hypothetical protein